MAGLREFSDAQLLRLNNKSNLHLLIDGKVYDVRSFVNEHPGGDLVLLGEAGKDATKAFEDVQHSDEARELLSEYLVGYCSRVPAPEDTYAEGPISEKMSTEIRNFARPSILYSLFFGMALLFWFILG